MLINFNEYQYYLVCDKTDMKCGAFSLARKVQDELMMNPLEKKIFIFCGSNNKCIKMLLWDKNGFIPLTKRLLSKGTFRWPNNEKDRHYGKTIFNTSKVRIMILTTLARLVYIPKTNQ